MNIIPGQQRTMDKSLEKLGGILSTSAKENDELLKIFDKEVRPKLKSVIGQHSLAGVVAGVLPTYGIATSLNLIIMYTRLCKVIDIPVIQELDKLLPPVISSIRGAFFKGGAVLVPIKWLVSTGEISIVGLPPALVVGALAGFFISNKVGNIFSHEIGDMVHSIGNESCIDK